MRAWSDRGASNLALLAPVLAAVIGGGAAIGAAVQIVELAPQTSGGSPGALAEPVDQDVLYGDR